MLVSLGCGDVVTRQVCETWDVMTGKTEAETIVMSSVGPEVASIPFPRSLGLKYGVVT
jgi:hypothetical protein